MDPVRGIFIVLHLIGMAGVIGGFMAQIKDPVKKVTRTMLDGIYTAVASGVVLVALAEVNATVEAPVNHIKISVKIAVALAIALLLVPARKKEALDKSVFFVVGLLALTNTVIAVLWR